VEQAVYESIYSLLNVSTPLDLALLTLQVDVVPNVTFVDSNGTNETNMDEVPNVGPGGMKERNSFKIGLAYKKKKGYHEQVEVLLMATKIRKESPYFRWHKTKIR